jgi:hypothetical protein
VNRNPYNVESFFSRKAKVMSTERALKFATANPDEFDKGAWLLGQCFGNVEWIKRGLESGRFTAETLSVDNVPSYLVCLEVSAENVLVVVAAAALPGGKLDFMAVPDALAPLAKSKGCIAIQCMTRRAGLAQSLIADGYACDGIVLSKRI